MFFISLSLPFLSASIFVYCCLYQNKDHQYLLKNLSWCHHALENVMNLDNTLSTACLHSFVISKPDWDCAAMQGSISLCFLSFSSFGWDKMMIKIWATPELHTLGIRMYQSKQDCISQKQPFPCIVLLKSRIFFMQQDIHRLGILQRSSCRRHRDRVKYKLARIPRVPGIPTRIPKVNTASLKTRVFWHLHFFF